MELFDVREWSHRKISGILVLSEFIKHAQ